MRPPSLGFLGLRCRAFTFSGLKEVESSSVLGYLAKGWGCGAKVWDPTVRGPSAAAQDRD